MVPHPFPKIVRDFQRVIGVETSVTNLEKEGTLPDAVVACVGGGSNAIGMFHPFVEDEDVALYGVEAAGSGIETGLHARRLLGEKKGSCTVLICIFCKMMMDSFRKPIRFRRV